MTTYVAIKWVHVLCVALSVTGFAARGLLALHASPLLGRRWVKTVPHVNDALLLAAALSLAALSGQYPFVAPWVTAKVFGLLAYIALGSFALRPGIDARRRVAILAAALLVFSWIVSVALSRNPVGFLRLLGIG